jgi:hypothetical protein
MQAGVMEDAIHFEVGDIIVPSDGTDYVGEVVYVARGEDAARHRCRTTGKETSCTYIGLLTRYMCVREIVAKNRQLLRDNFELAAEKDDDELELARLRSELGSLRTALRALLLSRDASWTGGHDWQVAVDQAADVLGQAVAR